MVPEPKSVCMTPRIYAEDNTKLSQCVALANPSGTDEHNTIIHNTEKNLNHLTLNIIQKQNSPPAKRNTILNLRIYRPLYKLSPTT